MTNRLTITGGGTMMFKFGKTSSRKLATCHEDLQKVMAEAIKTSKVDFCVICGHRGEKEQNAAFDAGNSQLRFPAGNHNKAPSLAVDVAPYFNKNPHIRWDDTAGFKKLAKHILKTAKDLDIKLTWGGDWENFKDLPHFELEVK